MTLPKQPDVKAGQIWVELDPREERYIEIMAIYPKDGTADVRRVAADGSIYPKARRLPAQLRRFNGSRGGYAIHKDTAP